MLDIYLLGTAATMPLPGRALSAAALTCSGRAILFDCGEGTQLALHESPVSPVRIDLICLTHYHGDHYFGLPGLLQTMGTLNRTDPLWITGPQGLEEAMQPVLAMAEEQPFPVHLLPMPAEGLPLHELCSRWPEEAVLTTFPTQHRIISQGYRLDLGRKRRFNAARAEAMGVPRSLWRRLQGGQAVSIDGRTIAPADVCGPARRGLSCVFTGDTMPCDAVCEAAREADLLIMDATYAEEAHAEKALLYGHATFAQTAELAARANVRRLWLTHFSAMIKDASQFLPLAQAHFSSVQCGSDGLHLALHFSDDSGT